MAGTATSATATRTYASYKDDRVAFCRDIVGQEPTEWQAREWKALDAGERRISVRSSHGVGKTFWLAVSILHYLTTRKPCKILISAPSQATLIDGLSAECRLLWGRACERIPQLVPLITMQESRIFRTSDPAQCFASFRTSRRDNPEALQGAHSDNLMLVVDEASGVPEEVFEAASGSMSTPGSIVLYTSNPTRGQGHFYDTHHKLAQPNGVWRAVKVSAWDSNRVDPAYIAEERQHGEFSNRWRVRILGEFPSQDEDTLIGRGLVEAAQKRAVIAPASLPVFWGVDPARSEARDKSTLAKRRGPVILEPVTRWSSDNLMDLTGRIRKEYESTPEHLKPTAIFVDTIGLGAGVHDRLLEMELPSVAVNVGEAPPFGSNGVKLRDALWLNLRDFFRSNVVHMPDDPSSVDEICSPTVSYRSDGREKCEGKDELRKRLGRSPDGADAICLTLAQAEIPVTAANLFQSNGSWGGKRDKGPLRRTRRAV